jgi:hypothetical protein
MQVHQNKESQEKQLGRKPGQNWTKTGLGRLAQVGWPSTGRARFGTPFDLAAIRTIYSPPAKSHEEIHLSFAAEEQRREGHHPEEVRVEMVD